MTARPTSPAEALAGLGRVRDLATVIVHGPNLEFSMVAGIESTITPAALQARIFQPGSIIHEPTVFSDPLAKHDYITGKVGGKAKTPVKAGNWIAPIGESGAPNLAWPHRRPGRPIGPDGGQSFHFAETTVNAVKENSVEAATAHTDYALDKAKVPIVDIDPELGALERGLYLFRDGVVPDHEGTRLAMTNMGKTDAEVKHAWSVAGETAKRKAGKPKPPRLKLKVPSRSDRSDDDFWNAVIADNDMPIAIKTLLDTSMSAEIKVPTELVKQVACVLRRHGWHDQVKAKQRPTEIEYFPGSSPVLQRRLVTELPAELPVASKLRIMHGMAKEFRERSLPFVLVAHKPDEWNNPENWHLHIDYHDRPLRKFNAATHQPKDAGADAGIKRSAQARIQREALANADPAWNAMWDAEIKFEYCTQSGKKKTSYPFAADVHPDTRNPDWIKDLRSIYADLVNSELRAAGSSTRYDPRNFEERGIAKESDVHLGSKLTRKERLGIPTEKGCANEQRQWDYDVKQLSQKFPLGHLDDGPPDQVVGYVQGYIGLIKERLTSRAQYVYTHAAQEAAALSTRANGTSTTKRRRDAEPYRLQEEAVDHLRAVGHLFDTLTAWTMELTAGLQSPGTSVGESASDSKMIRSNHNPAVRTAMPETEGPSVKNGAESGGRRPVSANAEGPAHSHGNQEPATTQTQNSASRESAARDDRAKRTSDLDRVGHQLSLFGAQANSMDTRRAEDVREVSKSVRPAPAQTPTNPDARTRPIQQRTAAPNVPTSEQEGLKVKNSTDGNVPPVGPGRGDHLIEKPFQTNSVTGKDSDANRTPVAKDATSMVANGRDESAIAQAPVGPITGENAGHMTTHNRHAAEYLIKRAEKRELLVLRDGPEMLRVNSPLGSSDEVRAVLQEKAYQNRLNKIFDDTDGEVSRIAYLAARSAKDVDAFLRNGKRPKSFSSSHEELITAWKANEDVRRAVAQIARLPNPQPEDHQNELALRVLFWRLMLNSDAAREELEQRVAAANLESQTSNQVCGGAAASRGDVLVELPSASGPQDRPSVPFDPQANFGI